MLSFSTLIDSKRKRKFMYFRNVINYLIFIIIFQLEERCEFATANANANAPLYIYLFI